ncbi:hypothetical protein BDW69DRAFT_183890 [Aspergillus filifer]
MPPVRSTLLLTLALALSSIDLCAAKDYSNTCMDINMADDCHSLIATCTAFKGNKKTTKLDLNRCFGNDNGFIVPSNGNQNQSALNLWAAIHMIFPGLLDNFVAQLSSKLVNVYLSEIDPLLQSRTEHLLDRDIGAPKQLKSINANKLSHDLVDHLSGRIVFGENLVDNTAFREPMTRYSHRLVAHGLLGRRFNIWPLSPLFARYLQWQLKQDLAIVARVVGDEVSKRRRQQQQDPNGKKPFDCIQWAMEQDIPEDQKTAEAIAQRLAFATSGMISTPPGTLLSFFFDVASQKSVVEKTKQTISNQIT